MKSLKSNRTDTGRPGRVAATLLREVALILQRELHAPHLKMVTLNEVKIASNLAHAKIFYSVLDESQAPAVKKTLDKVTSYIRHLVSQKVALRFMPVLQFQYDPTTAKASQLCHLINQLVPPDSISSLTDDEIAATPS